MSLSMTFNYITPPLPLNEIVNEVISLHDPWYYFVPQNVELLLSFYLHDTQKYDKEKEEEKIY